MQICYKAFICRPRITINKNLNINWLKCNFCRADPGEHLKNVDVLAEKSARFYITLIEDTHDYSTRNLKTPFKLRKSLRICGILCGQSIESAPLWIYSDQYTESSIYYSQSHSQYDRFSENSMALSIKASMLSSIRL